MLNRGKPALPHFEPPRTRRAYDEALSDQMSDGHQDQEIPADNLIGEEGDGSRPT